MRAPRPETRRGRLIQPGALWPILAARTAAALDSGALRPIETTQRFVDDGGVHFLVRQVSSLARKALDRAASVARPSNPFLPYEEALFVADLSDTHVALLNKFNVIPHHLLIVTRRFEDQALILNTPDFLALWTCLAEFDALGFYNGGTVAGASQPHKHLQVVPLPMAPPAPGVPMDALLRNAREPGITTVPGLPFAHGFCRLPHGIERNPPAAAELSESRYLELLTAAGIPPIQAPEGPRQSAPYNLLLTRDWMLLVPRSREHFEDVSVNALAYAGSLFVRDDAQMGRVIRAGPMRVLAEAGMPGKTS